MVLELLQKTMERRYLKEINFYEINFRVDLFSWIEILVTL